MLKYLYIDESGDISLNGSKYLILCALQVDNPAPLERIIKQMRRNKYKKILKHAEEIKGYTATPEMIKHIITSVSKLESAQAYFIVLEKGQMYSEYLKNNCHKMYNFVAGKLAQHIILEGHDLEIRVDKSKGKRLLRDDFNKYFQKKIRENSAIQKITLTHSYSHSWSGIQCADILAYACFQKFEHKNSEYLDVLDVEKKEIYHMF